MNSEKDQPLQCEVVGDRLVISMGVDTLAFADQVRTGISVTSPTGFAKDVAYEIMREDEVGATLLTDLLDEAMQEAANQGSAHVDHEKKITL